MESAHKSFSLKPADAQKARKWWVINGEGKTLGRLASQIAMVLRGKNKPEYTPHVDGGDFVIVVNATKIQVTGRKFTDKYYYQHSKYPGGLRKRSYKEVLSQEPDFPLTKAVRGMLPKNVLGREMISKLKVYGGADHPHSAQQPEPLV